LRLISSRESIGWGQRLPRALNGRHQAARSRVREDGKSLIEERQDCQSRNGKVSQKIVRLCCWRIAALLQKQLPFWSRCVMSAHPQQ
jgi:hypothetical protein